MTYRITGLPPEPFRHLFGLDEAELEKHGARRIVADGDSGMPDRIELRDARRGESVLLVHHEHHPTRSPFRSSHAVFVIEGATEVATFVDEVPPVLRSRLLSIRSFDSEGMMVDADVVGGADAATLIERLFSNASAGYLHVHYARPGCYAALVERIA